MSDTVVHVVGLDVTFAGRRRQRCAWCGQMLADDDFTRLTWALNEDGSDPGLPGIWEIGALVEVFGEVGEFRAMQTIDYDSLPDSTDRGKIVPENCCLRLDPEVTR